ncbi:H-2 class II histocompatibility antigen, A-K alpha chain-like [Scyliorhinus canicula]|uniref:H-2 class II histocompatibility antigen, A-K alpha chain-like n=1 Tax=Scyliorhinus canicula TaxID=7830 RepID=UPI0018F528AD|nr:H-2 class II histocompatibility antigen, A-K alpha chain-like [Scyliorhinus canicula]
MGNLGQDKQVGSLRTLLSLWLLVSAIECAKKRVRVMIFSTSAQQLASVTIATDDMTFAFSNNDDIEFHIEALNALRDVSRNLIDKYGNQVHSLNKDILNLMISRIPGERTEIPTVLLYPGEPVTFGKKNVLNCFVSELFPPVAHVSFQKNSQPLPGQVNSSQFTFDSSWMFQILKYVQIEPAVGDIYSCVVEVENKEQYRAYWESTSDDRQDPVQIGICVIGFVIGTVGIVFGLWLIFYKRENTSQREHSLQMENSGQYL